MRKLNTSDVFAALRVIRAANLREEIKPLLKIAAEDNADIEDLGIEGFLKLVDVLSEQKMENAVYEVLAGPLETTAEAVSTMNLTDLAVNIKQIAEGNDLKAFFEYVSGILGKR